MAASRGGGKLKVFALISAAVAILAVLGFNKVINLPIDIPGMNSPGVNSAIVADNGKTLTQLQAPGGNRIKLAADKITPVIRDSIVAAEDMRFYMHDGVDTEAALRAAKVDVARRDFVEGASTITMQLANLRHLDPNDDSAARKLTQARIATQMERDLRKTLPNKLEVKRQILTDYANEAPFCAAIGVEAASQVYFGHGLGAKKDTALVEAATLAAMLREPCGYTQPTDEAKKRLHDRRNYVLDNLRTLIAGPDKQSQVTNEQIAAAKTAADLPMTIRTQDEPHLAAITRLTVNGILASSDNPDSEAESVFAQGGYEIQTTINYDLQKQLAKFVESRIGKSQLKAGVVILEPKTGKLLAYYGGNAKTYAQDQFDYAIFAPGRRGGSSSKAFTLLDFLRQGYDPESLIPTPETYPSGEKTPFTNTSECKKQKAYTVREATVHSCNTAFLGIITGKTTDPKDSKKLIPIKGTDGYKVSPQTTADLTYALGGNASLTGTPSESKLNPVPSLTLGTSPMTVLQRGFALLPVLNEGRKPAPQPWFISKIVKDKKVLWEHKTGKPTQVVEPHVANMAMNIMFGATKTGTAQSLKLDKQDSINKTGTDVADVTDLMGNKNLACSVWEGYADNRPVLVNGKQLYGADAGQICKEALNFAFKDTKKYPIKSFAAVDGTKFPIRIGD